ncbi:MAG: hypothetical protein GKR97_07960 [Rhizobiaceae bacterium]|nr:hypothetical protein [Rhizobiaceae bacterium]
MYQFFSSDLLGLSVDTANLIANGIVALVIIFVAYMLYKMFTRPRMAGGRRSKNARLAITDAASIDDRRRIVLVRRDDVEHLIMIGGANDMVIESDINKAPSASSSKPLAQPSMAKPEAPATPAVSKPRFSTDASNVPAAPAKPDAPKPNTTKSSDIKPAATVTSPAAATAATPTPAKSPPQIFASTTKSPPGQSDASSLIGDIRPKPNEAPKSPMTAGSPISPPPSSKPSSPPPTSPSPSPSPTTKSTVGQNMDALLTEITGKK